MRISDWSSDVCSSDLRAAEPPARDRCSPPANPSAGVRSRYCQEQAHMKKSSREALDAYYAEAGSWAKDQGDALRASRRTARSEEHTSELQSLMRISYAVFCLKKKKKYIREIINKM